jgi:hypothetical protein
VKNLTVLTLRKSSLWPAYVHPLTSRLSGGNNLTYIPPGIAELCNLRELNLSMNKLTYLPSEMLDMRLSILTISQNRFPPPPPPSAPPPASADETPRARSALLPGLLGDSPALATPPAVSEATVLHDVPPLSELCLRVLLSAPTTRPLPPAFSRASGSAPAGSSSTRDAKPVRDAKDRLDGPRLHNLAALYGVLQPDEWHLPELHARALAACAPGWVAKRPAVASAVGEASPVLTGKDGVRLDAGVCPSPRHGRARAAFFVHAEERTSWESVVGGMTVTPTPVRWRGCSRGCLDFLDEPAASTRLHKGPGKVGVETGIEEEWEEEEKTEKFVLMGLGFTDVDFE